MQAITSLHIDLFAKMESYNNGFRIPLKSCRPLPSMHHNHASRRLVFHCSTPAAAQQSSRSGSGVLHPAKLASVLSIGTANPANVIYQDGYPDYYFRLTNSEHLTGLKDKFRRACQKSNIRKRHMVLNEDLLKENPNMCEYVARSLDARQDVVVPEVPKLGKEAALKAIEEWGQPKSKITHLIFCTTSVVDMPGADYQLTKLLDLSPSVNRFMMCQQGCFAGGTVLRLAKDIAENNKDARVLVVCSEITAASFRGPSEAHFGNTVGQALFSDGAAAIIVGANPDLVLERPLFQLVSASQTILQGSEGHMHGHFREEGLNFKMSKDVPRPSGGEAGRSILDHLEEKLLLDKEKLKATRHVLSEYGNMWSACVLFTLDGNSTTGEGLEWGVLFGFGPGITLETIVLHSLPIA